LFSEARAIPFFRPIHALTASTFYFAKRPQCWWSQVPSHFLGCENSSIRHFTRIEHSSRPPASQGLRWLRLKHPIADRLGSPPLPPRTFFPSSRLRGLFTSFAGKAVQWFRESFSAGKSAVPVYAFFFLDLFHLVRTIPFLPPPSPFRRPHSLFYRK